MYYLEKLTTQSPNEINKSVDLIIEKAKDNPELFKYLVTSSERIISSFIPKSFSIKQE